MAKRNASRKQQPLPPLSQPTFSVAPVSALDSPPPTALVSDAKGKERASSDGQSSTSYIGNTPPQLLNPLSVRFQPPVRWVYNYDHTDPLNFGFMFPVEEPDATDLSPLSTNPVSSNLSPSALAPDNPNSLSHGSPKSGIGANLPWEVVTETEYDLQQSVPFTHQEIGSSSHQEQWPLHQGLPHRYNPHVDTSMSTQQVSPSEEQIWFLPPHGTSIAEEFQDSVSDSRNWFLDGSNQLFQPPSRGILSTGTSPVQHTTTALAATKRKRSAHGSPSPTESYLTSTSNRQESSLCSRCKIYEKMNDFPGLCTSCLQVSFNTWPSALGTRSENLESLVLFLFPSHMEAVLAAAPPGVPRSRSWRKLPRNDQKDFYTSPLEFQDRWTLSKQQVQSTRLFGEDYAELANIAQLYQLSSPKPSKCLEASCTVLITICQLYKSIIDLSSDEVNPQTLNIPRLINNIRTARITLRHGFQQIQALSVSNSQDRRDWFPAFLSAVIMAVTAIIFLDILIACPSPYKEQIWGAAWHHRRVEMRNGGYGMLISLLRANSRGINPLKMDVWTNEESSSDPFINVTPESYNPEQMSPKSSRGKRRRKTTNVDVEKARQKSIDMEAQRERNILLGIDSPAALQGMLALKAWNSKYHEDLKQGEDMFSKSLFRLATIRPVAGLWRIFELE